MTTALLQKTQCETTNSSNIAKTKLTHASDKTMNITCFYDYCIVTTNSM